MEHSDQLETLLHRYFGFDNFLDHQKEVVTRIASGENLCVVMPTGAGKSLCYQLPALLNDSYTLVISPLIALMADQVMALQKRNIPAAYINSTVSFAAQLDAVRRAEMGELKLLYVAPERLQTDFFYDFLLRTPPAMLVVDEAHCISEWGHDFRPSYRRIGAIAQRAGITRICAFTATATPEVCEDIKVQLLSPDMQLTVAGFRRPNLSFKVHACQGGKEAKLAVIRKLLKEKVSGATIIYAATRQAVDELSVLPGVQKYHAGMSNEERKSAQDYFMNDPAPVLAATNAFGMGIDRPDVRRVIHYQLPGSLEAYYQEAGRAGRDGESAECLLLFSYADRYIQNFLIDMNNPPPSVIRSLYRILRALFNEHPEQRVLEITSASLQKLVSGSVSDGQINAALIILEKAGAIIRHTRQTGCGTLRFTADTARLKILHQEEKTQRSRFIRRMIDHFGEKLHSPLEITVDAMAEISSLSPEQIRRVLNALNNDILLWENSFSGRAIELVDPEQIEPAIDDKELDLHRNYEQARLDAVVHYGSSQNCRQAELTGYFGEKQSQWRCGICDNCIGSSPEALQESGISDSDIRLALRAAELLNGRVGAGKLAQILAGSRSAAIVAGNWHRNACFGALRKLKLARIEQLIRLLISSGDLEKVERNGYPCIKLSEKGSRRLYK